MINSIKSLLIYIAILIVMSDKISRFYGTGNREHGIGNKEQGREKRE